MIFLVPAPSAFQAEIEMLKAAEIPKKSGC
ncbi:hypothetical protein ABID19_004315 [Mesorhizobium robiniae]|uniref:Uncharacterized protein n=1 Tax=Mesorhizobium robiniae TaxID=559315 RepID=A0ABV2GSK9_9HYPH